LSKKRPRPNTHEHKMAVALDELAEFERFLEEILPTLRRAVKERWDPEKIYRACETEMAARQVQIAMMDKDPARALAAIKDALDRTRGKATEKVEITNKLEKLSDEELDALLQTELRDVDEPDTVQ
jgi:hypothetical protein